MKDFFTGLFEMLRSARYALWQQQAAVPDYWDGARTKAARCALLALVLFAGVLLVRLCMLLMQRRRSARRIFAAAATLGVVLGLAVWVYFPQPLAGEAVESVTLTQIGETGETAVPLTDAQQAAVAALLADARCRRSFASALPEGAGYRITYKTASGEASVLVGEKNAVRYTSVEKGLLCPVLSGGALYEALAAL